MILLALDSTTDIGSAALWCDGEIRTLTCSPGRPSSDTLLPLVGELLATAGTSLAALDGLAFGAGPGSFTGLRIACGLAQGLAFAHDLPLVPVNSLETIATLAGAPRVLACLDARMGEVYHAAFADGVALAPLAVCAPAAVPLPPAPDWIVAGNALAAYPELRDRFTGSAAAFCADIVPAAAGVARLAVPRLQRGETVGPEQALPLYVRDKVAQTVAERLAQGGRA